MDLSRNNNAAVRAGNYLALGDGVEGGGTKKTLGLVKSKLKKNEKNKVMSFPHLLKWEKVPFCSTGPVSEFSSDFQGNFFS